MYVDVLVAGIGKWYEFSWEEEAIVKDIINEMYITIKYVEEQTKSETVGLFQRKSMNIEDSASYKVKGEEAELYRRELNLVCIDKKQVLDKNAKLKECDVENGDRLILI